MMSHCHVVARRALLAVLPLLLLGGCTDLDVVPPDARLSCAASEDCPAGFVCRDTIGECVADEALSDAPIAFVIDPAMERSPLSATGPLSSTTFIAQLSAAPSRLFEVTVDGTHIECDANMQVECRIDAAALELGDGSHVVNLFAMDRAGNEVRGAATFDVDDRPPSLVGAPVILIQRSTENLQANPTALGRNNLALLSVSVTTDEFLAAAPIVSLAPTSPGGNNLPLLMVTDVRPETVTFFYNLVLLNDDVDEGVREIIVEATDTVGNSATIATGATVTLDITPPVAPTVDVPDAIVFARQPWGAKATDFRPDFSLRGVAGAFEPGALVIARTGEAEDSLVVGSGRADFDGSISLPLLPVDVARVTLVAVDGAGNVGPPATVRDIEWTASLSGKVPFSILGNPHRLFDVPQFERNVLGFTLADESPISNILTQEGATLTVETSRAFRLLPQGDRGVPALQGAAAAFHPGRGSVVVFGGSPDFDPIRGRDETYEIIDGFWHEVVTTLRPPPGPAEMVYDPVANRLVCVAVDASTWVFEDTQQWRELFIGSAPGRGGALAFDPIQGVVVRSNGRTTAYLDDDRWNIVADTDDGPVERDHPALGFDPSRGRLMLYGGRLRDQGDRVGDRWSLEVDEDTDTWTWLPLEPSLPRFRHHLVHAPGTDRLFVVGGLACADFDCLESSQVSELNPSTGAFDVVGGFGTSLGNPAVAYDPQTQSLLWMGGIRQTGFVVGPEADFLAMSTVDFAAESLQSIQPVSPARDAAQGFFDPGNQEPIFFLGSSFSGGAFIYNLDGFAVTPLGTESVSELPFEPLGPVSEFFYDGTSMAFVDEDTDQILHLQNRAWTTSAALGIDGTSAIAYDPSQEAVMLFGGSDGGGTDVTMRLTDGVLSTVTTANAPPPRMNAVSVYDPGREVLLLFGGFREIENGDTVLYQDTWAFDGTDWALLNDAGDSADAPATGRSSRFLPSFFYDTARGRPMIHTDRGLFSYTDAGWSREPIIFDVERSDAALVYDPIQQRLISYGGTDLSGVIVNDLEVLDDNQNISAAHVFDVDLRARGAAQGARTLDVIVRAKVGGRGYRQEDGTPGASLPDIVDGAEILLWTGDWVSLATNTAPPSAPEELTTAFDASVLPPSFDERLRIALTSVQSQGPLGPLSEGARVTTEDVEVLVRYRE